MKEKEIVKIVLDELINRKMLKKNITPQEKTKLVLKQYNKLILSIEKTNAQINRLEKEQKKLFPTSSKTNKVALQEENRIYLYTDETLQNRINELKQISIRAVEYTNYIKDVCETFKDDEYYPIIEYLYFQNKKYKDISLFFGWSLGTINKHRERLIDEISTILFSDLFISENS